MSAAEVTFPRASAARTGSRTGRMLPAHFGSFDGAGAISSYDGSKARIVPPTLPES